ncbi:MAG: amidase, partial [Proteobacteria bacterium]|nr:amidase [Pseudomonadota bacterium]
MAKAVNTLAALSQQLRTGSVSSRELTEDSLLQIARLNPALNAVITSCEDRALAAAAQADKALASGDVSPLLGIPMLHKDIFCTRDVRTTCASKMLAEFIPPYSATVVNRLETAGMISLGKCNMDEFAMGSSNETSFFGAARNPWDTARVPGGSSGGSAAAVAAGFATL